MTIVLVADNALSESVSTTHVICLWWSLNFWGNSFWSRYSHFRLILFKTFAIRVQNIKVRTNISSVPSIFFQQGMRWSPSLITDSKSWWRPSIDDMHERFVGVPSWRSRLCFVMCLCPLPLYDGVVMRLKYGTYKWLSSTGFALYSCPLPRRQWLRVELPVT